MPRYSPEELAAIERYKIATNPETPPDVLLEMSKSHKRVVREAVASNPATPTPILEALAQDPCTDVRMAVAENPNATATALDYLVGEEGKMIEDYHQVVAAHPNIDLSSLERLANSAILVDVGVGVCFGILQNPLTTTAILKQIAVVDFGEPEINRILAKRIARHQNWL